MNQKFRTILSALLLVVFLVSAGKLFAQWQDEKQAEEADRVAQELLAAAQTEPAQTDARETIPKETAPRETEPTEPATIWIPAPVEELDSNMDTLAQKDLNALREVNPDVVGWIWIPDTYINYPLMQGEDNEYYLNNTWNQNPSAYGSIYLESMNSPELTDFNTIIYGHNMNNGSMFATLQNYAGAYYRKQFPYVYIATDAGVYRYEIFSTYKASVDSITYQLSFNQQETREAFIQAALENAEYDIGIVPETTDRIITLSTCTGWGGYDYRRVVHARLKMIEVEAE